MIGSLLRRCDKRYTEIFADEAGRDGLTRGQYAVLDALVTAKGSLAQDELIVVTGIDRSSLSEMLNRMGFNQLVARASKPTNARAKVVSITAVGRLVHKSASKIATRAEAEFVKSIPPSTRAHLTRALTAVIEQEKRNGS